MYLVYGIYLYKYLKFLRDYLDRIFKTTFLIFVHGWLGQKLIWRSSTRIFKKVHLEWTRKTTNRFWIFQGQNTIPIWRQIAVSNVPVNIKHTVIRFVWVSAKFGTCTVVNVYGTFVDDKMRRFKGECTHFSFNNCSIFTHNDACAKLSTNHTKRITVQWGLVSSLMIRNIAKPNQEGGDIPPMNGILNQLSKGLTLWISFSVVCYCTSSLYCRTVYRCKLWWPKSGALPSLLSTLTVVQLSLQVVQKSITGYRQQDRV